MDFNFFDPLKVVKKTNVVRLAIICLLLVASIGTSANMAMTYYQYKIAEQAVASLNQQMGDKNYLASLALVDELQYELDNVSVKKAYLDAVEDHATRSHTVSWKMMNRIAQQVPVNLTITQLEFSGPDITIDGEGIDKITIAQFEYNLRETGEFSEIVVQSMKKENEEGDTYVFNMEMTLKDAGPSIGGDEESSEDSNAAEDEGELEEGQDEG